MVLDYLEKDCKSDDCKTGNCQMAKQKHHTGLSDEQVIASRHEHGNNVLTQPSREPLWKQFLEKFKDPLIIVLGVLLITPLTPILNSPALAPAFDQILPALFGGLGVVYIVRNWKIAIAPVTFMLVLFIAIPGLGSVVGILVPVGVLIALAAARVLYRKNLL